LHLLSLLDLWHQLGLLDLLRQRCPECLVDLLHLLGLWLQLNLLRRLDLWHRLDQWLQLGLLDRLHLLGLLHL
jgi:hypothetical protein